MTYYRTSYLAAHMQQSVYNSQAWPRNTLKSYSPRARDGYSTVGTRTSYAPRIPSAVRQEVPVVAVIQEVPAIQASSAQKMAAA